MKRRSTLGRLAAIAALAAVVGGACGGATATATLSPTSSATQPAASVAPASVAPGTSEATAAATNAIQYLNTTTTCQGAVADAFFNEQECEKQLAERLATPQGPADQPWVQMLNPTMVDTTKYKKDGPYKICVSESGEDNAWRVVGWNVMQHEAALEGVQLDHVIANSKDDKQISDIADLVKNGGCSALVVSPNSTAALTPAVQQACASGIPIVIFDRGVTTDCPVTFVHPIGGYAFGASSAEFIASRVPAGSKIVALRILPGVDVLETRWLAAQAVFSQHSITVVETQFDNADSAKAKTIVSDALDKYGNNQIAAVWADATFASVAVSEVFEERTLPMVPVIGEDQNDFLQKWAANPTYPFFASTYPTYQWRTAIIAATDILKGVSVPKEWILPQSVVTADNLSKSLYPNMPPDFQASCGCQGMPGWPADYQK
jgi:ribose transport system substrate-binding protein